MFSHGEGTQPADQQNSNGASSGKTHLNNNNAKDGEKLKTISYRRVNKINILCPEMLCGWNA